MKQTVRHWLWLFAFVLMPLSLATSVGHAQPSLEAAANQLAVVKLSKLDDTLEHLASKYADDTGYFPLLEYLLSGDLYKTKADKTLIRIETSEAGKNAYNPVTGALIGAVNAGDVRKIRINNKVRSLLKKMIARASLNHQSAEVRSAAVQRLMKKASIDDIQLLRQLRQRETDSTIQGLIDTTLAIADLNDSARRLSALSVLDGRLEPEVKNVLISQINALESSSNPADKLFVAEARNVLAGIEGEIQFYEYLQRLFFGVSLGSVLLLAAIGLSITFGVMGVINMAHGEMIMIGAYTTYVVQLLMPQSIEYSIVVAIPAAFLVAFMFGVLLERSVIRFLRGRPLETLLATFGVSLILQQLVRSVFSPLNRQVVTPDWMSGAWQINPVFSLTYNRLYIVAFALLVFIALLLLLKKTPLGLYVRAVSQDRNMARACGIRSEWVDMLTFGLGSGIAGMAGVALSQLTNVGPNLGQGYIIDSFLVVVFGGAGSLWGTLVGALSLGIANKFIEPVTGSVLASIVILVFIILFIQKRPKGLFPQKGRSVD
ncbi:High-affinity branched-chain amino acid transport system permease protein LivH [BD1-7 clade bacterium]|uniref:High-affinity branched-chain amino acid transport system permease protein LivH n=1 Tax=BD1-7 clade bacterium TaxID=2029982 RepID=A0A5S9QJK1_9GAMM|nr:High-affinity branched-chain amino acid transport system permease protein LivH [BD1-7 clade bacterium]